jgi:hypothetical protein
VADPKGTPQPPWQAVPRSSPAQPPGPPTHPGHRRALRITLAAVLLLVVIGVIGAATGSSSKNKNTASTHLAAKSQSTQATAGAPTSVPAKTPTSSPVTTAPPKTSSPTTEAPPTTAPPTTTPPSTAPPATVPHPPAVATLLSASGNSPFHTVPFASVGNWDIAYSFSCPGSSGVFQIFVGAAGGGAGDLAVNQLTTSGEAVEHEYNPGTFYLEINSVCSWHLIVSGPPAPKPTPGGPDLLSDSGAGNGITAQFTAAGTFAVTYSFTCSVAGIFKIYAIGSGASDTLLANELAASGSATSYEYTGGTYQLEIGTACTWHVTVYG